MIRKVIDFISLKILGPIKFDRIVFFLTGSYYRLTAEDRDQIKDLMEKGNYIWLNRRKTHLTTFFISLSDWALEIKIWFVNGCKGKFPKFKFRVYTHAFFNVDDDVLIEAIGKGVVHSLFDKVFDCDWAAAFKIEGLTDEQWKIVSEKMASASAYYLGRKYDTVFKNAPLVNLVYDKHLDKFNSQISCIELIRIIIADSLPMDEYLVRMKDFEEVIKKMGNLTPQMLRESKSFKCVLEIKR